MTRDRDEIARAAGPAGGSLSRRLFLTLLGAGATATLVPLGGDRPGASASARAAPPPVDPAFPHGVASGDPRPDGTVVWTRVDPEADAGSGVEVAWAVATTEAFTDVVAQGVVATGAASDHTVHVTVSGLPPDGWFHYRFTYRGATGTHTSRVGRLRTAPAPGSSPDRLRFAFASCQQITSSFYNAHAAIASEDLDFVVHYGDYIYVSDGGTITVDDYRGVWKRFKANPYLQELHRVHPMVMMWDDGEFVNGVDRFMEPVRFAAARQAWFEFCPVDRHPDEPDRTYRELQWGGLLDFFLLDVRQYRDALVDSNDDTTLLPTTDTNLPSGAVIFEPDRTCLGAEQKAWLKDGLAASTATWRHIGTGYPFVALRLEDYDTPEAREDPSPGFHVNGGKYISTEQWDGYWAERKELLEHIAEGCIPNVFATSGHTHVFFGAGIRPDHDDLPDSPVALWEFTTGSLTADPDPRSQYFPDLTPQEAEAAIAGLETAFLSINPHIDYIDLLNQGYGLVTVTPSEARCDLKVIDTFDESATARSRKTYSLAAGSLPEGAACGPSAPDPTDPTDPTPTDPSGRDPAGGPATAPAAEPIPGVARFTG